MDEAAEQALTTDKVIDITTTGRTSGEQRRIEIWFHNVAGQVYITGSPGRRSWYANVLANPEITFHLKESVEADLAGTATAITDVDEKRRVLLGMTALSELLDEQNVQKWVDESPLIQVDFPDA